MHETPVRPELIEATDAQIEDAVQYAELMALRGLLYLLTGDEAFARTKLEQVRHGAFKMPTVVDEADVALLRNGAAEFLKSYRDSGAGEVIPVLDRLADSVRLTAGLTLSDDDVELYMEELGLPETERRMEWQAPPPADTLQGFKVLVIGAGMGGLTAARELKRAGIPYEMVEKNAGVGGTWHENRYPGARVDTPSRGYTNTFGVAFAPSYAFCPWPENQRYFDWVADSYDLRENIQFNTEIRTLTWDQQSARWIAIAHGPDGEKMIEANAVITAVGFLNRPNVPEIPGIEQFDGECFHTARWPDELDLKGKRFAVVGTGCTGYQVIPELALEAEHVTVFQRTAQWLTPTKGYLEPSPPQVNWLDRNLPFYSNFLRCRSSLPAFSLGDLTEIDPDFDDPHACNPKNKEMRDACIDYLVQRLGDADLVRKMTPPHPVRSARPVTCDADYNVLDAILADNTTLVDCGIRRINKNGVEANDGTQHDVDVIVFATGFRAHDYLYPMTVTGRDGKTLDEVWADKGPRAYCGSMVPDFPNLWMVYGPNTNGALGPATFHELVTRYALMCMQRLILDERQEVSVREAPYIQYNEYVDSRNATKVWSDPRAQNYYWSSHGRSVTQNPFSPTEMFRFVRSPRFEDLDIR
ncbi:flavin-containing monooxygenase [Novosphingobium pentaromativorans]|uniref:Flavin-containing monooxygenase-like protein n=1 Tax=Novosphingobium pentaromativorans US6-1 TaxID=1088721 RepID=G6EGD2_9SPHN|nr:NAD(P)/FAD-dependent oxidoreductase [Novosphingobium pentaromativorans]AIT82188.1 monooxygenase [Novosphingobium pentaromativorans US6-1]EHJ59821.1 Flavin-containing monooxygenase-like protein [Novosphingobium pentaromativorans US6-1]